MPRRPEAEWVPRPIALDGLDIDSGLHVKMLPPGMFGDGSDGDVTISSDTNLARDMFYDNLIVDSTKTLSTKGYRIYVVGKLTNNGAIVRNGNDGTNAQEASQGVGGAALTAGSLGGAAAGGDGGQYDGAGDSHGGGGGGAGAHLYLAARIIDNGSGTISANGGDGGDAFHSTGGAAVPIAAENGFAQNPGAGGNGGAGGDSDAKTGGTAGVATLPASAGGVRGYTLASLQYDFAAGARIGGGAGGGGGAGTNAGTDSGGGGGGGGGGTVCILYHTAIWGTETASGGTGGTKTGTGDDGGAGVAGIVSKQRV